jgi:hypothetical protein
MIATKIYFILMILSLCILISCKERKEISEIEDSIIELNIRESLKQQEKVFFLSDLSDEIKYVPLETNDSCLLYGVYRLMLTHEYILVSDGLALYQFDLTGRFIRQIGRPGKGPGEHGRRIKVDAQNEDLFIFSSGIMNIYDLETGSFKRNFKVDFDVSDFNVSIDDNILFFTSDLPSGPLSFSVNEVFITDNNGEIINSIVNHSRLNNRTQSLGYVNLYKRNGEFKYIYNFRDTLYALTENFKRRPYVVLNLDNLINRDKLILELTDEIQLRDFIWVSKIIENNNYIFLTLQKGISAKQRDIYNLLYDKINGDLIPIAGFINNIDAGMTFWPQFSIENTLIDHYQPYEIIEYYNSTIGTANHSDNFKTLVNNLDESGNPVLVFIEAGSYLKNE